MRHLKNLGIALSVNLISFVYFAKTASAQAAFSFNCTGVGIETCIASISENFVGVITGISVVIAVVLLPIIGMQLASGDPGTIQKGKDTLVSFVSGFLLVVFSGVIIKIVLQQLLGVY